jgi:hypothetical protein
LSRSHHYNYIDNIDVGDDDDDDEHNIDVDDDNNVKTLDDSSQYLLQQLQFMLRQHQLQ